jgi:hypothetical protein
MQTRPDNLATKRFWNPLWWHIAARSVSAQCVALLLLPTALMAVSLTLNADTARWDWGAWQGWLKLVWPAALALALADLRGAMSRDDTALCAALMGWSRAWVRSALLVPALVLVVVGASLNVCSTQTSPSQIAQMLQRPALPNCKHLQHLNPDLNPQLLARCEALVSATELPQPLPLSVLRRLPWSHLTPALPGSNAERLRRLLEPALSLPLAFCSLSLARRLSPTSALPRSVVLLATLAVLSIGHALWSLLLVIASQ